MIDIEKFSRKLNIKFFFMEAKWQEIQAKETSYAHSGLRNKSTFNTKPYGHKYIDVFKNMVQEDIIKLKKEEN